MLRLYNLLVYYAPFPAFRPFFQVTISPKMVTMTINLA